MITRREARELAFQIIFEKAFSEATVDEIITYAEEARGIEADDYARSTATGVYDNLAQIDEIISRYSVARSLRRLSKVVLSVLRLAVFEILFIDDIDASISINEAVELTKLYATEEEGGFVNGVLGTFVRTEGLK